MEIFVGLIGIVVVVVVIGLRIARRDTGDAGVHLGGYDAADPNILKTVGPPTPFRDAAGLSLPHRDNGPGPTPGAGGD